MSLEDLKSRWNRHEASPFPEKYIGGRPGGHNLLLVESELGAAIVAVILTDGRPSTRTLVTLKDQIALLKDSLKEITQPDGKAYFETLLEISEEALSLSAPRKSMSS